MEKFKTVNQIKNALREGDYKFKYINNKGLSVYWDCDGNVAHVDLLNKTIDYKGITE